MCHACLRAMTEEETAYWYHHELCEAFPPQERKPLADILALRSCGRYELLGFFEPPSGGSPAQMIGYATLWKAPELRTMLLDYLGVTASMRNAGVGSRILSHLKQHCAGRPLLVESEAPSSDDTEENRIRTRRIQFYVRNGFTPVYEMATCGLRWQAMLLGTPPATSCDAFRHLMHEHKALYGPGRSDVEVPLPPGKTPAPPYWMVAQRKPDQL